MEYSQFETAVILANESMELLVVFAMTASIQASSAALKSCTFSVNVASHLVPSYSASVCVPALENLASHTQPPLTFPKTPEDTPETSMSRSYVLLTEPIDAPESVWSTSFRLDGVASVLMKITLATPV